MDKLKAALAYKFWMMLGVALLVPFIGWWMASSAISAQVEERIKKVDGAFSGLTASGENPNEKWTAQIKRYIAVQEVAVQQAHQELFERQRVLLTWPDGLSWTSGTIPAESQITQKDIDYYRNLHDSLVELVHQIPKPIDPDTGEGLVDFPIERLPHSDFSKFPPRREEIIQTREDMWLYSDLLRAIARVNEQADAKLPIEAPIRQILKIELRGGKARGPAALGGAEAAGGASAGPAAGGMPTSIGSQGGHGDGGMAGMRGMKGTDAGAGGMGGMRGGAGGGASVDFDPAEDFGSDSEGGGGGASAMAGMPSSAPGGSAGPSAGHGDAGGSTPGAGSFGGSGSKGKRYIEDNPKYKTRGFYLSLTMDHKKLPYLLVELANSSFPIRVMRVQQADLHMQDLAAASGSGGSIPYSAASAGGGTSPRSMPFGRAGGAGAFSVPSGEAGLGGVGGAGATAGAAGSTMALDDPMLAHIALCGFFTIYKPPPAPASAGAPAGATNPEVPATPSATGAAPPVAEATPVPPATEPQPTTGASSTPAAAGATPNPPAGEAAAKPENAPEDGSKKKEEPSPAESPQKSEAPTTPENSNPTNSPPEKPIEPTS
jgi:hypothetical protein